MNKLISILILSISIFSTNAQVKIEDFGSIILNTYLPENSVLPSEAKSQLKSKLSQLATNNGMGGSQINARFIITAKINIGTKDIISGPPQMIAQNLELILIIGDALTNIIFSNTTLSLKGIGTNENKAFIEAFKNINPKNKDIAQFLAEGKSKIKNYYNTNCNFIIKEAFTWAKQEKYDDAIYQLALVPESCQECYFKCLDTLASVYQQKIDADCKVKLKEAKLIWATNQTPSGAEKAGDVLSKIYPMTSCEAEIDDFLRTVDAKLKADEKAIWHFKMQQYTDKIAIQKEQIRIAEEKSKRDDIDRENQTQRNYELDKIRINKYRDIVIEYLKNKPQVINYNNIHWK